MASWRNKGGTQAVGDGPDSGFPIMFPNTKDENLQLFRLAEDSTSGGTAPWHETEVLWVGLIIDEKMWGKRREIQGKNNETSI